MTFRALRDSRSDVLDRRRGADNKLCLNARVGKPRGGRQLGRSARDGGWHRRKVSGRMGGTEHAIDRLTWEIAHQSPRTTKTTGVWVVRSVLSLKERRGPIAGTIRETRVSPNREY